MAQGIAIDGKKLHKVQMPLKPHSRGVVSCLLFPKGQFKFSLQDDTLRLAVPAVLGMELYRSGVLPQDAQTAVAITISGRSRGRFAVTDVRYPGGTMSTTTVRVPDVVLLVGLNDLRRIAA